MHEVRDRRGLSASGAGPTGSALAYDGRMVMDRIERWALRRAVRAADDAGRGRLVYVDAEGVVRDLGAYAVPEVEGLAWAVGVAYRTSRVRHERTRLAGLRAAGQRLGVSARSLREQARGGGE
jgi:hypothetical protein